MDTLTETGRRPESAQSEAGPRDGLGSFGLIHLAACLGAGMTALLAVNLIESLT